MKGDKDKIDDCFVKNCLKPVKNSFECLGIKFKVCDDHSDECLKLFHEADEVQFKILIEANKKREKIWNEFVYKVRSLKG